jgi:hypothetical protein
MDSPFRKKEQIKKHYTPRPFKYLNEIEIATIIYKQKYYYKMDTSNEY